MRRIFWMSVVWAVLTPAVFAQFNPGVRTRGAVADGEAAVFDGVSGKYIRGEAFSNLNWKVFANTNLPAGTVVTNGSYVWIGTGTVAVAAGVSSWTAGVGMTNTGTAANPTGDLNAATIASLARADSALQASATGGLATVAQLVTSTNLAAQAAAAKFLRLDGGNTMQALINAGGLGITEAATLTGSRANGFMLGTMDDAGGGYAGEYGAYWQINSVTNPATAEQRGELYMTSGSNLSSRIALAVAGAVKVAVSNDSVTVTTNLNVLGTISGNASGLTGLTAEQIAGAQGVTNGGATINGAAITTGAAITVEVAGAAASATNGINAAFIASKGGVTSQVYTVANVRNYGATGDGATDDTTAFTNALAASSTVFVPAGNYVIGNIVIIGARAIFGVPRASVLTFNTNSTGYMIVATNAGASIMLRDLDLAGGSEINRNTNLVAGARSAVRYATQDRAGNLFDNVTVHGFSGYAFAANEAVYTGNYLEQTRVRGCTVSNCFAGVSVSGRSEFTDISDCGFFKNGYDIQCYAGNTHIINCIFASSGIQFDLMASAANDAHGTMVGCKFFDSASRYSIRVLTNTLGFVFSGNSIYHSPILVQNSKAALFIGNEIGAPWLTFVGPGTNYFYNNIFNDNGDANVVTNDGTAVWENNFTLSGALVHGSRSLTTSSSISATQLTAGTVLPALDGSALINLPAGSTSGVTSITGTGAVSGAITFTGNGVTQSGNTFTFTNTASVTTGAIASLFMAYTNAAFNIASASVFQAVTTYTEAVDKDSTFSGGVWTPAAGTMFINGTIAFQGETSKTFIVRLYKNNAQSSMLPAGDIVREVSNTGGAARGFGAVVYNESSTNQYKLVLWSDGATRQVNGIVWGGYVIP
jgi:hypothetical protein